MKPIYLDYNATTPIAPEVARAMQPFLEEHFGNPSSSHPYGLAAQEAVEKARVQVARLLGCQRSEVVFTSGGTESNNYAIKGVAFSYRERGNHIITSAIEHPSVTEVCRWLETQGFRITFLPVDKFGLVNPVDLERALTPETILVTVMQANNEVGTIQPIAELAKIAQARGALMHTDAAQSTGKIPVQVKALGVDLLSIAGHKLYAPKGVGALYIKNSVTLTSLMHGAAHENHRRAGTENVLGIVGLGRACELAAGDLNQQIAHQQAMRNRLLEGLQRELGEERLRLNGHPQQRLPNTLSLSFRGLEAKALLAEISSQLAASAGAACHSGEVKISAVLAAMQVPPEWARGTIRFSVGRTTSAAEIDQAIQIVAEAVRRLG